ncbi:TetR/AcrR family transcriptional regulator [Streptomyces sp. NRRL S-31]|uniref:TetR/AcrR family transcriptional regulator n=1 Tax=Streptomyces sp. NRRL S-31 TaxID=1463898 RepID=UPI0006994446|nr:TetR/AcrR family transcriptional regulator [Streptomyces sp. NRRL S-31]
MIKQDRARRTHELLLDAAAAEFVRFGYMGANLQRVAEEARMTKGALYAHFASKRLLAKALTAPFEHAWHELLAEAEQSDAPPVEKLRLLAVRLAERLQTDLRFRAGFHLASESARAHGRLPSVAQDLHGSVSSLTAQARQQGQLTGFQEPERLGNLLLALMFGVYYSTPDCRMDRFSELVCTAWWQALGGGQHVLAAREHCLPTPCHPA